MKLVKLNQRGDASLVIIGGICLMLIGVASYFAYQAGTKNSAKREAATASPSVSASPAAQAGESAVEKVKTFYTAYAKTTGKEAARPYVDVSYLNTLFPDNLSYDPVLCTQGGGDQPMTFSLLSANATTAQVQMKQPYDTQDMLVRVDVRLSDLMVTKIQCPAN